MSEQTPVNLAAEHLLLIHYDGEGCGTYGTSACTNCFGPSPMTAHEIVRDVFSSIDVTGISDVIRMHWLHPAGARYGAADEVTTRKCNCAYTLQPQYFEWRHWEEHNQHVAEEIKKWLEGK